MLIPAADFLNHSDIYIRYESECREVLESISLKNDGDTDFTDFLGESHEKGQFQKNRFYSTRLEKLLENSGDLSDINSIWDLDSKLKDYRSSSDEEDTRTIGEVDSEEEDLFGEEYKSIEIRDEPDMYFIIATGSRTGFNKGEQVYSAYGRLNNRDLLLDYGFTLDGNRYDALYFRL